MHRLLPVFALFGFQGIYGATINLNCSSSPTAVADGNGPTVITCPGVVAGPNEAIISSTLAIIGDYVLGGSTGTNTVQFSVTLPGNTGGLSGSSLA